MNELIRRWTCGRCGGTADTPGHHERMPAGWQRVVSYERGAMKRDEPMCAKCCEEIWGPSLADQVTAMAKAIRPSMTPPGLSPLTEAALEALAKNEPTRDGLESHDQFAPNSWKDSHDQ